MTHYKVDSCDDRNALSILFTALKIARNSLADELSCDSVTENEWTEISDPGLNGLYDTALMSDESETHNLSESRRLMFAAEMSPSSIAEFRQKPILLGKIGYPLKWSRFSYKNLRSFLILALRTTDVS